MKFLRRKPRISASTASSYSGPDRRKPENAAFREQLEQAHRQQVVLKAKQVAENAVQNQKAVSEVEARVRLLRIQSGL